MSAPRRFTSEDLALFAMQLLSNEESAEVSAYLEQSEEGRRELAEIQGDLAIYAHTVEMQAPPEMTRERLMKQVAKEKKAVPIDRPIAAERQAQDRPIQDRAVQAVSGQQDRATAGAGDGYPEETGVLVGRGKGFGSSYLTEDDLPPKRSAAAKIFPWVGWAVAAGLAVTAGNLYRQREALQTTAVADAKQVDSLTADAAAARQVLDTLTDTSAMRVTLNKGAAAAAPVPQGRATYVASKGALIFVANNLEPLPADKTYELWLIPAAAGENPIPAGTFHPDERGNASVILPPLPKGVDAKAFGVTIESAEGAATPTLPIILVGT